MRDLTRASEDLSEDLARTQVEISIMERAVRELATMVDRVEDARKDPFRQQRLNSVFERLAMARARQSSIALLMEECGRERSWRTAHAEKSADAKGSFDALIRSANCGAS
jgi:hypothetical protein